MVERLLLGLVGTGIQGSRTPAMHRAEGAAQGIAVEYRLIDTALMVAVPPLPEIIAQAEAKGFAGLNVTYPFKREVIGLLDEMSLQAEQVGAVNTVLFRAGRRIGHNTDVTGFADSLRLGLPGADLRAVLLLGAGGAGAAVAHALGSLGAGEIMVADHDTAAAERLAEAVNRTGQAQARAVCGLAAAARTATGIVNATPMGMAGHPGMAIPPEMTEARHWVGDVVYVPIETELLLAARARGCATLSGAGMAVHQAVHAFRLFTGRDAVPERMRATFDLSGRPAPA